MLCLRTMLKDDLGTSPLEPLFGSLLTVHGEFVGHGQVGAVVELLRCPYDNVEDVHLFLKYTMLLSQPHRPHLCFRLRLPSFAMTATSRLSSYVKMDHFMNFFRGTIYSKFSSAFMRRPLLWMTKDLTC